MQKSTEDILKVLDQAQAQLNYLSNDFDLRELIWDVILDLQDYNKFGLYDEIAHFIELEYKPGFYFSAEMQAMMTDVIQCHLDAAIQYAASSYPLIN